MKNSGKAAGAALRIMFWSLVLLLAVLAAGVIARYASQMIAMATSFLIGLWVLFTCFTFYFFRDPDPALPASPKAVVSPAHGTVDVLDEVCLLYTSPSPRDS